MTIYPFADQVGLGGEVRGAPNDEILARFAGVPLFDRKQAEAGTPYWTEAYSDPSGAGWMVGYAAPVRADGRSVGVVGTAVPLDFVNSFVRAFDYPAGHLWLLNGQGQVLAASDGRNQEGVRLLGMDDVLPEALRAVDLAHLLDSPGTFTRVGDQYVFAQPVSSTPWTLLFAASTSELNQVVLPRLVPSGIILAGLILTLLLAHLLRQRLIVRPALSFANYIHAEAGNLSPKPPALPGWWQPLAGAAADAFQAQRSALARIQDSEALKSAIINSALDALITIDESGKMVEFSPSAEQMFGIERSRALGQPLAERDHSGAAARAARSRHAPLSDDRRVAHPGPAHRAGGASRRRPGVSGGGRGHRGAAGRPAPVHRLSARHHRAPRHGTGATPERTAFPHRRGSAPGPGQHRPAARPRGSVRKSGVRRSVPAASRPTDRHGQQAILRRPRGPRGSDRCAAPARRGAGLRAAVAPRRRHRVSSLADLASDRVPGRDGGDLGRARPHRAEARRGGDRAPARSAAAQRAAVPHDRRGAPRAGADRAPRRPPGPLRQSALSRADARLPGGGAYA